MYEYKLERVIRVVDADTLDLRISLGFGIRAAFRFRLANVDAPEIYGRFASEHGQAAKAFVETWLSKGDTEFIVRTYKSSDGTVGLGDGAFGRWLCDIIDSGGESLSHALVEAGFTE